MNLVDYSIFEKELLWLSFNKTKASDINWDETFNFNLVDAQVSLFANNEAVGVEPSKEFIEFIKSNQNYKDFKKLAKGVLYHHNSKKFHHLYVLFNKFLSHPQSLFNSLDEDVRALRLYQKQIGRDIHKMHAFVRFNKIKVRDDEVYVANHIPDHHIIEKGAQHFKQRYSNMNWIIYSDNQMVIWNKVKLSYQEGEFRDLSFEEDQFLDLWKDYYKSIFNPARVKIKAMKNEMPVRYWKKMPETQLISELVREAPYKVDEMIKQHENTARIDDFIPSALCRQSFNDAINKCKACSLNCNEVELIDFKENAQFMLVFDEMPKENERDMIMNQIKALGSNPDEFHFTALTKHKRESGRDIQSIMICRRWLLEEKKIVKPRVVVAFGPVAVHCVFGYPAFERAMIGEYHNTAFNPFTLVQDKIKHIDWKSFLAKLIRGNLSTEVAYSKGSEPANFSKKYLTDIRR